MLTKNELFTITGINSNVSFDNNCPYSTTCPTGTNKYAWLFDHTGYNATNLCTRWGCNKADLTTSTYTTGYWTSDIYGGYNAWFVGYYGYTSFVDVFRINRTGDEPYLGVRPVIEINL